MFNYLIRRVLYAIPILFGVVLVTFVLSNVIQKPETRARVMLGPKANPQAIQVWLEKRGYDKPLIFNTTNGNKFWKSEFWDSQFFNHVKHLATFELGVSDKTDRDLKVVFKEGAIPSLLLTFPAFIVGLCMAVSIALYQVYVRGSALDTWITLKAVALMSVPAMVYIFVGQRVIAQYLNYFPSYGFNLEGWSTIKFLFLPVVLMAVMGLGGDVRLYRAVFLEEIGQDYVRTAMAKGVSDTRVLFVHVLKNGMIALITLVVAHLPLLIMGSLLVENFFGIPGLGNTLFLAIQQGDFSTVYASAYLGSILYLVGLVLTDICYALVDPRIRLS